jgi:hypothetical protein
MGFLLSIFLAVIYALLGLLLLVLLLPFRAGAFGSLHDGEPSGVARVDWGFGLLGVELDTGRRVGLRVAWLPVARFTMREKREKPESPPEKAKPGKKVKKKQAKAGALDRLRAALAERAAFRHIAARIVRAVHLRARASGRIGTGDPADAAALFALLQLLRELPGVELELELDWVEEALDLEVEVGARIWIAELLAVAALLLLERPNRRALRVAIGGA